MSPTQFKNKLDTVIGAWSSLAASVEFGGLTLTEFQALVAPSLTARTNGAQIEQQLSANIAERNAADAVSAAAIKRVVFSVKGNPAYGDDSALYRAMGYKTASETASGLSRSTATQPTEPSAV